MGTEENFFLWSRFNTHWRLRWNYLTFPWKHQYINRLSCNISCNIKVTKYQRFWFDIVLAVIYFFFSFSAGINSVNASDVSPINVHVHVYSNIWLIFSFWILKKLLIITNKAKKERERKIYHFTSIDGPFGRFKWFKRYWAVFVIRFRYYFVGGDMMLALSTCLRGTNNCTLCSQGRIPIWFFCWAFSFLSSPSFPPSPWRGRHRRRRMRQ